MWMSISSWQWHCSRAGFLHAIIHSSILEFALVYALFRGADYLLLSARLLSVLCVFLG
jgi:hypothetical protein